MLDIPRFEKFVLISSPFLESSEINHKTFEIQGQNRVLSFMETFVLSICKSEFSVPFGNVCLTSSWKRFYLTFNSHFTRRTIFAGYSPSLESSEISHETFEIQGQNSGSQLRGSLYLRFWTQPTRRTNLPDLCRFSDVTGQRDSHLGSYLGFWFLLDG